jgi:hypothetical protein
MNLLEVNWNVEVYYVSRQGGLWIFLNNQTEGEYKLHSHYISPDTSISDDKLHNWYEKWIIKRLEDSGKWENIKFTIGYSYITPYKHGYPTAYTPTTTANGVEGEVIIFKGGVYHAAL